MTALCVRATGDSCRLPLFLRLLFWFLMVFLFVVVGVCLAKQDWGRVSYLYFDRIGDARRLAPTESKLAKAEGDVLFRQTLPPDLVRSEVAYREALRLNPYAGVHWRDWADLNLQSERTEDAFRALKAAEILNPSDYEVQMEIGNMLLGEGRSAEAVLYHSRAIRLNRSLAPAVYPVYWALEWEPFATAQALLGSDAELLQRYWLYCLDWLSPEQVADLWRRIQLAYGDIFDAEHYNRYFNYLISRKQYAEARELWDGIKTRFYAEKQEQGEESGSNDQLFWNGNFRFHDLFPGGLEWRLSKSLPGSTRVVISTTRGVRQNNCLWINFRGKENVSFAHVQHFLFVEPGKTYRLKYHVSSLDLTTDNGPYVRVRVYSDPPSVLRGEMIRKTGDWYMEQEFTVPDGAEWAEVTICRDRSTKLNNRIKGDVWFDDFTLEEVVPDDPVAGGDEKSKTGEGVK